MTMMEAERRGKQEKRIPMVHGFNGNKKIEMLEVKSCAIHKTNRCFSRSCDCVFKDQEYSLFIERISN